MSGNKDLEPDIDLSWLDFTAVSSGLPEDPLVRKFKAFHEANPHIYQELRRLALKMRGTGRKRYGIKSLFEVLRWHRALASTDDDFKLNNNYTSFYARVLMEQEPELAGFFNLRKSRSES